MTLDTLYKIIENQISNEKDPMATLSNICSLIFNEVENLNWVGFYFLRDENLVLGMFQGKIACTRIKLNKGVCGYSFSNDETVIVKDVHNFKEHIACDSNSKSEIVIPIHLDNKKIGVLDIDSPIYNRFSVDEKLFFENVRNIIEKNIDLGKLLYN